MLVTGCASGGAQPFTPGAGVEAPPPTEETSGAPPETTPGAVPGTPTTPGDVSSTGLERLRLGPTMTVSIDRPGTDPELMKLFTDYYTGVWKAVLTQGEDMTFLRSMMDPADRRSNDWVQSMVSKGHSVRGPSKVYSMTVVSNEGGGAEVNACIDEGKLRLITAATGVDVVPQPKWLREPYLQRVVAHREDDGVWRVRDLIVHVPPDARAMGCRR